MSNSHLSHVAISDWLEKMITYCQFIHELLEKDGQLFVNNDFSAITLSNQKKMELITRLTEIVNELQDSQPNSIKTLIKTSTNDLPTQNKLLQQLENLNQEVKKCYQHLEVNNHVVFYNLRVLKEVWDKLVATKRECNVYNKAGIIV